MFGMATAGLRIVRVLERGAASPLYLVLVGAAGLAVTVSMTIPFASVIVPAVLLSRRRWLAVALTAAVGSALGGLILYLAFHHLAWGMAARHLPMLQQSAAWQTTTRWVAAYGVIALGVVAALPLPSTPVIAFAAIERFPVAHVALALWLGKSLKYGVYAYLAAHFPDVVTSRVARRRSRLPAATRSTDRR
jgi:membrane protein YqaA with SNARE-associated domain